MEPFKTEDELLRISLESAFIQKVQNKENTVRLIEPKGLFGIPDVLIVKQSKGKIQNVTTTAFEMKLRNWQRALVQAYKYKAFSEYSYVVIDHYYITPALKNISRFQKANIGLVSIDIDGNVYKHVKPLRDRPYCPTIKKKIATLIDSLLSGVHIGVQ